MAEPHGASGRLAPDVQLRVLRDFTSELVDAVTVDDVLRGLARCAQNVLAWDDCVVYLVSPTGTLLQRAAFGAKSPDGTAIVDPIELAFGEGIVGAAAASGESQLVTDTRLDDRYIVDDRARLSELAVPIVAAGEVIGVIDSEHDRACYYTIADQKLLEDVAAIAAVRVRAALTLEQVENERRHMEQLAATDDLTGLGNRRRFEAAIGAAIASRSEFSVCILDLDRFKLVNDRLGHPQGDAVLLHTGAILARRTNPEGTLVCRLGGDEFGLIRVGPGHDALDAEVDAVIEAVRTTSWPTEGAILDIGVSAGVASGREARVWRQADDALLVAKADGGNRLVRFDQHAPKATALREDRLWVERITRAITDNRFFLVAQEIVPTNPASMLPPYHELLLRLAADDGSIRSPASFLDSAARYGMLERVDSWVIRHAVAWLADAGANTVSINVTPGTLISGRAIERLAEALADHDVDPRRVILEVTENAAIVDACGFAEAVRAAHELGVRVAIDDLGSGWTSLAVIRDNPVDIVKIDGSWVRNAVTDPVSRTAVRAITECAHLLGSQVVAEWVEDESTRALMAELGVEYVQGYLIGEPMPLASIASSSALPDAA